MGQLICTQFTRIYYTAILLFLFVSDMSAWSNLFVPQPVLAALAQQGFTKPTQIQELCLPAAIRDYQDVLGAAETVSTREKFSF